MLDYPQAAWATLARTAGRYPDGRFGDDLARLATGGLFDAESLLRQARTGANVDTASFDALGLAWFAHVRASQREDEERARDTADLFRLAYQTGGRRALATPLDTVWVQALHLAGRLDEFRSILKTSSAAEVAWWGAAGDTLNTGQLSAASTAWLEHFNTRWVDADLEPLTFADGPGSAFDRVHCPLDPSAYVTSEPLVTVVMPVFNPGPSLRTAVQSLTAQSWTNLEILICDDASTRGWDIMEELATSDDRVRIVTAERNAGAYAARNRGLGVARGEFVTFNDADDWSHPRRVERQVRAVLDDPAAVASLSWSVRLSEEMHLTVMGRIPERINLSSILFSRLEVLKHLGGFDAMRKGADSEFVSRFTTVLGADALVEIKEPLALVQLTSGSLSRDDYQFLRTHPARLQYMADLRHWHREVHKDPAAGYLPPGSRAPFPAASYLTGSGSTTHDVDIVVLANLSDESPTVCSLADEVRRLAEAGLSVGLVEFLAPYDMTDRVQLPDGPLAALMRSHRVSRVLPTQPVTARLAVIRDPASVEAMPASAMAAISARSVLVVADYEPGLEGRYHPVEVTARLHNMGGATPVDALTPHIRWLPATSGIGTSLRELLGSGAAEVCRPTLCAAGPLRAPESTIAWPSTHTNLRVGLSPLGMAHRSAATIETEMAALLPEQRSVEVLIYEPNRQVSAHLRRRVNAVSSRTVSPPTFIQQVDALIVGPAPGRGGHLDRMAVLATTYGRPLIASPDYRDHFGDAALYLDEAPASEWAEILLHDDERRKQATRASMTFGARLLGDPGLVGAVVQALTHDNERWPE